MGPLPSDTTSVTSRANDESGSKDTEATTVTTESLPRNLFYLVGSTPAATTTTTTTTTTATEESTSIPSNTKSGATDISETKDGGHRYGNFHNYYAFNPTKERMKLLQQSGGILDFITKHWGEDRIQEEPSSSPSDLDDPSIPNKKRKLETNFPPAMSASPTPTPAQLSEFNYLDIGCNEGDLTMAVAKAIAWRLSTRQKARNKDDNSNDKGAASNNEIDNKISSSKDFSKNLVTAFHATGVDIDDKLIHRANQKYKANPAKTIIPKFQVSSVLLDSFLSTKGEEANGSGSSITEEQHFDLTSIFSTTMWIHIHGGDEGLCQALERICRCTKSFVLIEPQPSKCYRSAMLRIRKMGLPALDVSSERLTLRPKLEQALDDIFLKQSFRRVVDFKPTRTVITATATATTAIIDGGKGASKGDTTKWNRSVWLYQRITKSD